MCLVVLKQKNKAGQEPLGRERERGRSAMVSSHGLAKPLLSNILSKPKGSKEEKMHIYWVGKHPRRHSSKELEMKRSSRVQRN